MPRGNSVSYEETKLIDQKSDAPVSIYIKSIFLQIRDIL
jgi:hypothetical protein